MSRNSRKSKDTSSTRVGPSRVVTPATTSGRRLVFLPTIKPNKMCAVAEGASFGPVAH